MWTKDCKLKKYWVTVLEQSLNYRMEYLEVWHVHGQLKDLFRSEHINIQCVLQALVELNGRNYVENYLQDYYQR